MGIAVFPGSFDPITVGHIDVISRAALLFDTVYVAVLDNPAKQTRFSLQQRRRLIQNAISGISNVKVGSHDGLLVDYCRSVGASCIIRGIRTGDDVAYEIMLEAVNNRLAPDIVTVCLLSKPEHSYISSSLVRQLIDIGISIDGLVPNADDIYLSRG